MVRRQSAEIDRRTFVKGTGAALGTAAVGGVATARGRSTDEASGADVSFGEGDDPIEIAHRGFAGQYPENTVAAAVGSGLANADAIEIDVVPCAGGEVVVFHDDGLSERAGDGLTDREGLVWETDCETVLEAEVLNSGETVPTLEELMDAIPTELAVNIELKNPGSANLAFAEDVDGDELDRRKELWRPFVEDVFDVAANYDNEILVSSFYEAALAVTREIDESIPVAFLFWDSIEEGLRVTREYDCEALHPPFDMIQGSPFFDTGAYIEDSDFADIDLLEVAHEEGRTVNVYTVTTWYEAEQLAAAGVDGLIADYPGLLTASDPGRGDGD
ncbi:glycerophosphodiester phosphodiesterase family protein [Haloprofundus halobius]|uniref:glycerophosphodiester phosphodiesterase family protein n=1 Tax=Haloprofundus halobius TaxID=2876194 RepID=UPI001CCEF97D|nr:glycerophosphodiester phosphodiesterase family protein [Haloprofundus halobius]